MKACCLQDKAAVEQQLQNAESKAQELEQQVVSTTKALEGAEVFSTELRFPPNDPPLHVIRCCNARFCTQPVWL